MTEREKYLEEILRSIKKRVYHTYCEDPWYSCPMAPEGCADDKQTGCTCGAQEILDLISTAIDGPNGQP